MDLYDEIGSFGRSQQGPEETHTNVGIKILVSNEGYPHICQWRIVYAIYSVVSGSFISRFGGWEEPRTLLLESSDLLG